MNFYYYSAYINAALGMWDTFTGNEYGAKISLLVASLFLICGLLRDINVTIKSKDLSEVEHRLFHIEGDLKKIIRESEYKS